MSQIQRSVSYSVTVTQPQQADSELCEALGSFINVHYNDYGNIMCILFEFSDQAVKGDVNRERGSLLWSSHCGRGSNLR